MKTDWRICLVGIFFYSGFCGVGLAQSFEAVMPSGEITAKMEVQDSRLLIEQQNGRQFTYQRDSQFDSIDGRFVGYFHPQLHRVLRLPRSGSGPMMMANLNDRQPHYQQSSFIVRRTEPPVRLPTDRDELLGQATAHRPGQAHRPGLGHGPGPGQRPWPGHGHRPGHGYWPRPGRGHHGFVPVYTPNVYWPSQWPGFYPGGYFPGGFYGGGFYGGYFSGTVLNVGNGFANPYPLPTHRFMPQSIIVDTRIVAGPPLAPAPIGLRNSSNQELIVTVIDTAAATPEMQIRIPAGGVVQHEFARDSASTRIQTYETILPSGEIDEHQVSTRLSPSIRYELVVHTRQIQSIAIDRTGKSPNRIEDVNYQGKGIGRFPLPPGDQLRAGTIDVYQMAINRNQPPGLIQPLLDPTMFD